MPELYNLAAFNGGLWDRTGSRPILPPREAIERLKLFVRFSSSVFSYPNI